MENENCGENRMYRITREFEFCYGHRLIHYEDKCRHLHGHNGRVVVTLEGDTLDKCGMLVDFAHIKKTIKKWVDDHLDHTLLLCREDPVLPALKQQKEKVFVMDDNPTAENIARLIFDQAVKMGLPVVEIAIWETSNCLAAYRPAA